MLSDNSHINNSFVMYQTCLGDVYSCIGDETLAFETIPNIDTTYCSNHCQFGQNFKLDEDTIVSSFEMLVSIQNPGDSSKRTEIRLMKGTPPLNGVTPTAEEWSRDNLIATIFNSATDSLRGGDCRTWASFPLTPAIRLDAGTYTISLQMVDDDGYYKAACDMHDAGGNIVWFQKPDTDLADWKYSIPWSESSGWGSKTELQRILALKVNSGSSCNSVGK